MMGAMNGVAIPELFTFDTYIAKVLGLLCGQVAGLCLGQEGPMAHIGAATGIFVLRLPVPGFEFLRNDTVRRRFIAAGFAAGIGVAFGAPIGGTLMAFELSLPNTFWRLETMWQTFFCSAFAMFTLAFFTDCYS